jgi:hypothetical protein
VQTQCFRMQTLFVFVDSGGTVACRFLLFYQSIINIQCVLVAGTCFLLLSSPLWHKFLLYTTSLIQHVLVAKPYFIVLSSLPSVLTHSSLCFLLPKTYSSSSSKCITRIDLKCKSLLAHAIPLACHLGIHPGTRRLSNQWGVGS